MSLSYSVSINLISEQILGLISPPLANHLNLARMHFCAVFCEMLLRILKSQLPFSSILMFAFTTCSSLLVLSEVLADDRGDTAPIAP